MSRIPQSIKCDVCGKSRIEDSNHWRSFRVDDFGKPPKYTGLVVLDGISDLYPAHACGEECASKLFAYWLSTGRLEERKYDVKVPASS